VSGLSGIVRVNPSGVIAVSPVAVIRGRFRYLRLSGRRCGGLGSVAICDLFALISRLGLRHCGNGRLLFRAHARNFLGAVGRLIGLDLGSLRPFQPAERPALPGVTFIHTVRVIAVSLVAVNRGRFRLLRLFGRRRSDLGGRLLLVGNRLDFRSVIWRCHLVALGRVVIRDLVDLISRFGLRCRDNGRLFFRAHSRDFLGVIGRLVGLGLGSLRPFQPAERLALPGVVFIHTVCVIAVPLVAVTVRRRGLDRRCLFPRRLRRPFDTGAGLRFRLLVHCGRLAPRRLPGVRALGRTRLAVAPGEPTQLTSSVRDLKDNVLELVGQLGHKFPMACLPFTVLRCRVSGAATFGLLGCFSPTVLGMLRMDGFGSDLHESLHERLRWSVLVSRVHTGSETGATTQCKGEAKRLPPLTH